MLKARPCEATGYPRPHMRSRMIMIFGISPRSGTNFLFDVAGLHPEVQCTEAFYEDGFCLFAEDLDGYSRRLTTFWKRFNREHETSQVMSALGVGLEQLLRAGVADSDCVLTKTPFASGIHHGADLFPDATPVVVVRNAHAVVASAQRTWGTRPVLAAYRWASGAGELKNFLTARPETVVIRYEDLVQDPVSEAGKLFEAAGLEPSLVTADMIAALGVRGSSSLGRADGDVHWRPVERPADFDPTQRALDLTENDRRLVEGIVAEGHAFFGYDSGPASRPTDRLRVAAEVAAYRLAVAAGRAPSDLG